MNGEMMEKSVILKASRKQIHIGYVNNKGYIYDAYTYEEII